jgi:hypothetical protein
MVYHRGILTAANGDRELVHAGPAHSHCSRWTIASVGEKQNRTRFAGNGHAKADLEHRKSKQDGAIPVKLGCSTTNLSRRQRSPSLTSLRSPTCMEAVDELLRRWPGGWWLVAGGGKWLAELV